MSSLTKRVSMRVTDRVLETTEEQTPVKWICHFLFLHLFFFFVLLLTSKTTYATYIQRKKETRETTLTKEGFDWSVQFSYRCSKTIPGLQGVTELTNISQCKTNCSDV